MAYLNTFSDSSQTQTNSKSICPRFKLFSLLYFSYSVPHFGWWQCLTLSSSWRIPWSHFWFLSFSLHFKYGWFYLLNKFRVQSVLTSFILYWHLCTWITVVVFSLGFLLLPLYLPPLVHAQHSNPICWFIVTLLLEP